MLQNSKQKSMHAFRLRRGNVELSYVKCRDSIPGEVWGGLGVYIFRGRGRAHQVCLEDRSPGSWVVMKQSS